MKIKLPFVSRKRYEHFLKLHETQCDITKYWQKMTREAHESKKQLEDMLKEATKL